jgi:site-specific DNA-methyltransferase (adenine-specific)
MVDKTQVFNRDCLESMREFPDKYFELAIVDPPYGNSSDVMNLDNGNGHVAKRKHQKEYENKAPSNEYFDLLVEKSKQQIIWGANFFGLKGGYLCWNKNGTAFGEAELAYCSMFSSVRVVEITWNGMIQHDMKNKEHRIHTHQKPVALYKWLLKNYAKEGDKILDTHLGSGSSRIAAFDGGFEFWGYELDSEYFAASEKRFQQHKSQLKLF